MVDSYKSGRNPVRLGVGILFGSAAAAALLATAARALFDDRYTPMANHQPPARIEINYSDALGQRSTLGPNWSPSTGQWTHQGIRQYLRGGTDVGPDPTALRPKSEEEDLIDRFKKTADKDGDGQVSVDELKRAIEEMGYQAPKFDDRFRIVVDPDGGGIKVRGCPPGQMIILPLSDVRLYVEPETKLEE